MSLQIEDPTVADAMERHSAAMRRSDVGAQMRAAADFVAAVREANRRAEEEVLARAAQPVNKEK